MGNSVCIKNDCLVNWDKLEYNRFPIFIIDTRSSAEWFLVCYCKSKSMTHCNTLLSWILSKYQLIHLAIWCRFCFVRVTLQENIDKYQLAPHFNLIILWYTLTEQFNKYFFSCHVTLFNLTLFILSLQTFFVTLLTFT